MQLSALTRAQVQTFKDQSYLLVKDQFYEKEIQKLQDWVDDLSSWAETPTKWMKYFEEG